MEDNLVNLTAVIFTVCGMVFIASMFFGKVQRFKLADVELVAEAGKWFFLSIKGKNTKEDSDQSDNDDN